MSDEDLVRWAQTATRGIAESSIFLQLFSQGMADDPLDDPIPVIQLGYAILKDLPIVIVAPRGARIPEKLRRMADTVAFYDREDEESLQVAVKEALREAGVVE